MTDEQLKAEIRTALNLGSLSNGLGEGFPCIERFEGICKAYAASQVAEIESRNAALVAALENVSKEPIYFYGTAQTIEKQAIASVTQKCNLAKLTLEEYRKGRVRE